MMESTVGIIGDGAGVRDLTESARREASIVLRIPVASKGARGGATPDTLARLACAL